MSFSTLDLNLLKVFDAIMAERSVVRASHKVCLTQSAVSHSLGRLRDALSDELFVRTASGMQPTPRAFEIAPAVRDALRSLEAAVDRASFDPAVSRRTFTLAANDFTTLLIIPELMRVVRAEAPGIDVVIKPVTRIDLAEQIDLGRIDAAIGSFSSLPPRYESRHLFSYDDVVVVGRHCTIPTKLSIAELAQLSIVVVSFGGEQDGAVDGFIAERGLARRSEMYDRTGFENALAQIDVVPRIVLSVPHFLALSSVITTTDLVAIVPRPLAKVFEQVNGTQIRELPYAAKPLEVRLLWHERNDLDAAQMWLHDAVRRASETANN
jgi:DNA-binding transcriptional LysR family regulator